MRSLDEMRIQDLMQIQSLEDLISHGTLSGRHTSWMRVCEQGGAWGDDAQPAPARPRSPAAVSH